MTTKFFNRVKVNTVTTGTGTIALGSVVSNAFCTFAEAGVIDGDLVSYVIEDGNNFEAGIGTYTASGATLSRDTVRLSKISGTSGTSKISLSGAGVVFLAPHKEDIVLPPAGHLYGLTLSNAADANNDITVAAGEATDETGSVVMVLASSITKQLDASWSVGNNAGGINTGSEAASTWYEVHLIKRQDTGVVDVMFTTTASRGTLPSNYTWKRRIGWIRNDGSSNILAFTQVDDYFTLTTQINDVSAVFTSTATQVTVTVPPNCVGRFRTGSLGGVAGANLGDQTIVFSEIAEGNVTPSADTGLASLTTEEVATGVATRNAAHMELRVDGNSQIEHDSSTNANTAGGGFDISTFGWIDRRRRLSAT